MRQRQSIAGRVTRIARCLVRRRFVSAVALGCVTLVRVRVRLAGADLGEHGQRAPHHVVRPVRQAAHHAHEQLVRLQEHLRTPPISINFNF